MTTISNNNTLREPLIQDDINNNINNINNNNYTVTPPYHRRHSIAESKHQFITNQINKMNQQLQQALKGGNSRVFLYLICLLVTSVGNSIYFKKMTNAMPNYPYFLSQLTTLVYVPVFFSIVLYEYIGDKNKTTYTSEVLNFPKYKFLIMGLFDSLGGVLALFGGVHTAGSTQALMNNAVIPITMLFSIILLKERYAATQYLGATIIMIGVGTVLLPNLINTSSSATSTGGGTSGDIPVFNILFFAANIPSALSGVYKEVAFKDTPIDIPVNWLQSWVALYQLLIGLLLIPINTLSILGDEAMSWSELPTTLINGSKCLIGIDSVVESCGSLGELPCDQCQYAYIPLCIYLLFNLFFNLFIILVIKHGSAALMYLVLTLKLPIVQLAFTITWINDPPDTFSPYAALGLILIISGLIAYRWSNGSKAEFSDDESLLTGDEHNTIDGVVIDRDLPNIHVPTSSNDNPTIHLHSHKNIDDYNVSIINQYTPPSHLSNHNVSASSNITTAPANYH